MTDIPFIEVILRTILSVVGWELDKLIMTRYDRLNRREDEDL